MQFNKCTFCITLTNRAFSKCEFERDWPYPDVTKKYVSMFDSTSQCKQKWHALQKKTWPKTWITLGIVEMKWTGSLCMLINVYWKNNSILHEQMEFQRMNVMSRVKIHGGEVRFALKIYQIALKSRPTRAKKVHDMLINRPCQTLLTWLKKSVLIRNSLRQQIGWVIMFLTYM